MCRVLQVTLLSRPGGFVAELRYRDIISSTFTNAICLHNTSQTRRKNCVWHDLYVTEMRITALY